MADHVPEELVPTVTERHDVAQLKAQYEAFVRGGEARAGFIPRHIIPDLAFASVGLMLLKIINGQVKPKSAKEAAEVARIVHEIGRREVGEGDVQLQIKSAEDRTKAMERIALLSNLARERARGLEQAPPAIEVGGSDRDPDLDAGGIPQAVAYGDALVIVPPNA